MGEVWKSDGSKLGDDLQRLSKGLAEFRARETAGKVIPTLQRATSLINLAKTHVDYARGVATFAKITGTMPGTLESASKHLDKMSAELGKLSKLGYQLSAAIEISEATAILYEWRDKKRTDAEAAAAFDRLFGGVAVFAKTLPPPARAYAQIFAEIKVAKFFTEMQKLMTKSDDTAWKIITSADEQFKPAP